MMPIPSTIATTLRIVFRNRAFAIINLSGLTLGFLTAMFMGLWIADELSYDTHLAESQQVYRIYFESPDVKQPRTPHPLAQAMVDEVSGVEAAVSISPIWSSGLTRAEFSIRVGEKVFAEDDVMSADSTFFDVFPYRFLAGDPGQALKTPMGVVLTRRAAMQYFGTTDAIGKTMIVNGDTYLSVTGVMEDIPDNTHFTFDLLVSYVTMKQGNTGNYYTWADFGHYNYIKISRSANPTTIEKAIGPCILRHVTLSAAEKRFVESGLVKLALQPVTGIHLHSSLLWELGNNGSMKYIWIFSGAALLLLIIASINFTNLSAARAMQRARETGLRKTFGSTRKQLMRQFLGEALLMTFLALAIATIIGEMTLPLFNQFTGKNIDSLLFYNPLVVPALFTLGILVGLAAGSYPAFILSAFQPSAVLKGYESSVPVQARVRKALLIFQFAMSAFLITGTLVINRQLTYLQTTDTGFDSENLMVVPLKQGKLQRQYPEMRKKLIGVPGIAGIGAATNVPGKQFNINLAGISVETSFAFSEIWVDEYYPEVLGIRLNQGQFIAMDPGADTVNHFLINEAGARLLNLEEPLGRQIIYFGDDEPPRKGTVTGIVSDFNFKSLHEKIGPLIILQRDGGFNFMIIRVESASLQEVTANIEKIYKEFDREIPFSWYLLNHDYRNQYANEIKMSEMFTLFSVVAMVIALIGLLGMVAYLLEQQRRVIGIRKVLGATTHDVVSLNLRQYLTWVVAGNLVAIVPVWWVMNTWLNNFAYRITFPWDAAVYAFAITLLTTLAIIAFQTYQAASANPVEAIKYE